DWATKKERVAVRHRGDADVLARSVGELVAPAQARPAAWCSDLYLTRQCPPKEYPPMGEEIESGS
ncbi:MAG TPA: hypothetical protein VNW28_04560, partial [Chthoniobacterales bacterium]|nr:hypothetical protein [Chthoniobacterales bacterium]